jgi:hypothetical protein
MEQSQQAMPEQYMNEIVRWFSKLEEQGLTNAKMSVRQNKEVNSNKLQITTQLLVGKNVLASNVVTIDKSLSDVKAEAQIEKARLQSVHDEAVASLDEVINLAS